MKTCTVCNTAKPESEFAFRNKKEGTRRAACKTCVNVQCAESYKSSEIRRKAVALRRISQREVNREYLFDHLRDHHCVDCNESNPVILEFDHLHDKVQDVVSLALSGVSVNTLQKEIDKCEVVCANCHRKRTASRGNHWRHARMAETVNALG